MTLTDKTILIVGGAAGIGSAAAELCAARGARVIVADLDEVAGNQTAERCNGQYLPVNVTDELSVQAMYALIERHYGHINVLLHTAGVLRGAYQPLEEFPLDTWRAVLDVNTTGSFLCAKHAVPLLKKAGGGVIVLTSSGAAVGGSSSFAYGASKGGVSSLGVSLANALAKDNIRVNVVSPGNIDTAMKRSVIAADVQRQQGGAANLEQAVSAAQLGQPEGVARVLAFLASDEAEYVRGLVQTR